MYNPPKQVPNDQQQALYIQDQKDLVPLTATMLAAAPSQQQKDMLGERLFPRIKSMYTALAPKITGMLLEMDNSELLHLLEHDEVLEAKVEEAMTLLQAHLAKQVAPTKFKME